MTYKIKELIGTRYLYVEMKSDLYHLFETCDNLQKDSSYAYFAGNPTQEKVFQEVIAGGSPIFDFAGTKITSDIANTCIPRFMYYNFEMIDSENADRDRILRESFARVHRRIEHTVELPIYLPSQKASDYIKALDSSIVYDVPVGLNPLLQSLVIMITMLRPKIQLTLQNNHTPLFEFVSKHVTASMLERYDSFIFASRLGLEVLEKDEDGLLHVQGAGRVPPIKAAEYGALVPSVFGTQVLAQDEDWKPLFNDCIKIVNANRQAQKKRLCDVVKGGPLC